MRLGWLQPTTCDHLIFCRREHNLANGKRCDRSGSDPLQRSQFCLPDVVPRTTQKKGAVGIRQMASVHWPYSELIAASRTYGSRSAHDHEFGMNANQCRIRAFKRPRHGHRSLRRPGLRPSLLRMPVGESYSLRGHLGTPRSPCRGDSRVRQRRG